MFSFSYHYPTVGNEDASDRITAKFFGTNGVNFHADQFNSSFSCGEDEHIGYGGGEGCYDLHCA